MAQAARAPPARHPGQPVRHDLQHPLNDLGPAGRYAPSPTGDLHLGNLRTGLLAWLFARSSGRRFLLRIEDLDASRVRHGMAERQRADLEAIGLDFDAPVLIQSERGDAYAEALEQLADLTYECFCTRREIAEAASAPHGHPRRYPGTCRELSAAQRDRRRETRPAALRVRADDAEVVITDLLRGEVRGRADDVVVRRADGVAAYNLAVVVDDGASDVDQVVRGDDLLDSAIDQAWLATRLGLAVPTYAHVPLALNPAGQRLAKRDGAVTRAQLGERGVDDRQLLRILTRSLELPEERPTELIMNFDPVRLPRSPWVVDPGAWITGSPPG